MDDGCTIIDTITTVCLGTPPLPATGGTDWGLTLVAALVIIGNVLVQIARRR